MRPAGRDGSAFSVTTNRYVRFALVSPSGFGPSADPWRTRRIGRRLAFSHSRLRKRGGGEAEGKGGIEGFVEGQGLIGAALVLIGGGILLTFCAKKSVSCFPRTAFGLKISLFALAIILSGVEFDDTIPALGRHWGLGVAFFSSEL